ncbi:Regulatory protein RecX [[Clostridium] ultunense Esp]|uniref:Regulatory protein RecX n=1 Tax=[Clostridium] ultunense Esp TaxID=1288971 RepID=M1ZHK9_9FIRM|nr:regulatory protein RecX [Schnuerera ultunensis]CCQ97828.1 Regulatory protein RecX [[Clostridium] ultunense Esp]SHD77628.1 Regulatory protein RecX [[Clostridium] ultunense Esp]
MIITKIEPQNNGKRVNVYLNGEFAFGLMVEIQYKYGLKEGMVIDQDFVEEVLLEEEQLKANNAALSYLTHRKRTEKEIIDKLKKKGFEENIIEKTLDYLQNYGLVNDLDFASSFARDKIKLNKQGPQRIKYELYRKGISQEIIEEILKEDDEYPRALELAKKKLPSYKNDNRDKIYRKLGGFLQRRGYSYDCVSRVLKELLE